MDPSKIQSFQPRTQSLPTATRPADPNSRAGRAQQFFTQALPIAMNAGLQELATARAAGQIGAAQVGTGAALGGVATKAGTAGAATAATTGGSLATLGAAAGTTLNVLGGLYGAFQLAANWGSSTPAAGATSGAAVGATIGSFFAPGVGTAIGAAIGAIGGGLIGAIRSGKHGDQMVRDQVRDALVNAGVLDQNFKLTFPDGGSYDMGLDGGPRADLGGRRAFEVDTNNPLAKYAVSWMNPLIELISQGNEKIKTDFVGYFANAVLSGATSLDDVRARVSSVMQKFGINDEMLAQSIEQGVASGQYSQDVGAAYMNGIVERTTPSFVPAAT